MFSEAVAMCRPTDLNILIVESNAADAQLTVMALAEAGLHKSVTVVSDGESALAYLRKADEFTTATTPHVVFLDLSLPRLSGLELLEEIRKNPAFECIPVVVVSGTSNPEDVRQAYRLRANCFITKPGDLDQFLRFMRTCYDFWATVVTLPPAEKRSHVR